MTGGLFTSGIFFFLWTGWLVAALAALTCAALALGSDRTRGPILKRYPVGWVTWVLLAPFVVALAFALILMAGGISDGHWEAALWALIPGSALVLCGVVGVWCTRARKGRVQTWPWLPAAAGFGVPALCAIAFAVAEGFSPGFYGAALMVAVVCGGNGLLAMWVNEHRQTMPPPSAPNGEVPEHPVEAPAPVDYRREVPPPPPGTPGT